MSLFENAPTIKKEVAAVQLPRTVAQVKQLLGDVEKLQLDIKPDIIERFCLLIMADKTASHRDRLQAARLLAQIKGYLQPGKATAGINGARIKWVDTITVPVQDD